MKAEARSYIQSSSFKMALLFTLLLGLAAAMLGFFFYYFNQSHFVAAAEEQIRAEIRTLTMAERNGFLMAMMQEGIDTKRFVYLLQTSAGEKLAGTLPALPVEFSVMSEGTLQFDDPSNNRIYAARIHSFPDGRKLLVGADITRSLYDHHLLQMFTLISILLMALVVITSYLISTFVVTRTNRIAETARQIMETGDLTQRIELISHWDDLSHMAHVLNAFLARIEELVQGVRHVSDNIAHDLRTPLTRLRNNLETLREQSRLRADEDTAQSAEAMIAETEDLLATFNALLNITRIETSRQTSHFSNVDLTALLRDVADLYEPLAEERNISLSTQLDPVMCFGDRNLLFQLFANLLDNATKFTPEGGAITIQATTTGDEAEVTITDSGPGIPESEHVRVFERFYRMERSRTTPGNGMGLSLVSAAVRLHRGSITLRNAAPGLAVTLHLPVKPVNITNS